MANFETAMFNFASSIGFHDGWRRQLPNIDEWHATRAARTNGVPGYLSVSASKYIRIAELQFIVLRRR